MSETLEGAPFEYVVCEYKFPGNSIIILKTCKEMEIVIFAVPDDEEIYMLPHLQRAGLCLCKKQRGEIDQLTREFV